MYTRLTPEEILAEERSRVLSEVNHCHGAAPGHPCRVLGVGAMKPTHQNPRIGPDGRVVFSPVVDTRSGAGRAKPGETHKYNWKPITRAADQQKKRASYADDEDEKRKKRRRDDDRAALHVTGNPFWPW